MNLGGAGSLGCLNWAWWLSFCFWVLRTSIFSSCPFPFFLSSYKITIYNSYCIWNGNFGGLTKKHMELEQKPRWKVTIYHQQQGFNTWILDFKIEKVDFPWKSWEFGFSPIKKWILIIWIILIISGEDFPLNPSIESTTLGVALIFSIPGRCGAKRVGLAFQEGGLLQAFHGRRRVV